MQPLPSRIVRPFLNGGLIAALSGAMMVSLLVLVTYWPARENGFVWDDWVPLVDSPVFRDPARWREAMLTAPLKDPVGVRPFAMLSFMFQLWAGQREPGPFHVVNLSIHAANAFLLVVLVWRVLAPDPSRRKAALAAALSGLVYGLHPALTEPVVWISGRYDLMMTFFLLLALLLDRTLPAGGWTRALLVSAAFVSAVLSKETAVGFLLALPFVHLALDRPQAGPLNRARLAETLVRNYRVYAALLLASVLYLAVRLAVFGTSLGMQRMVTQFGDVGPPGQRILAVAASLSQYVGDALWPFRNRIPSRSFPLPIDATDVLPMIAASAGVLVAVILAARAGAARRVQALLFLAFVASLVPVSNLLPLPGRIGELWAASRYLAFPLAVLFLAAPFTFHIVEKWLSRHFSYPRSLLAVVVIAWLAASVADIRATIPLWKNDGTLNYWAIQNGARSYWRYQNLGDYYLRIGAPQQARKAFLSAVNLRSDVGLNWYYLGLAEAGLGNTAQAKDAFRKALERDRSLLNARINLAKIELAAGRHGKAAALLEESLERLPQSDRPEQEGVLRYLLGQSYVALGRREDAAAQLEAALALARNAGERDAAEKALRSLAPPR